MAEGIDRCRSLAWRAISPCTDIACASMPRSAFWLGFQAGTRPSPGFTVTAPLAEAGKRSEPPISLPCPSAPMPAITADPAPPEDPPADRCRPQGL